MGSSCREEDSIRIVCGSLFRSSSTLRKANDPRKCLTHLRGSSEFSRAPGGAQQKSSVRISALRPSPVPQDTFASCLTAKYLKSLLSGAISRRSEAMLAWLLPPILRVVKEKTGCEIAPSAWAAKFVIFSRDTMPVVYPLISRDLPDSLQT
jgi:hypothetical protein